jgi:hypothetical protein
MVPIFNWLVFLAFSTLAFSLRNKLAGFAGGGRKSTPFVGACQWQKCRKRSKERQGMIYAWRRTSGRYTLGEALTAVVAV